jgi:quinol monooxygenase YgiN
MVQLLIKLVAPVHGAKDLVHALRIVLRPAQQARGCRCAQIYQCVDDDQKLEYVEEWEDGDELRGQFGSERFVRLFELLESSAERPVIELRVISETHGLEYFVPLASGRSSSSSA